MTETSDTGRGHLTLAEALARILPADFDKWPAKTVADDARRAYTETERRGDLLRKFRSGALPLYGTLYPGGDERFASEGERVEPDRIPIENTEYALDWNDNRLVIEDEKFQFLEFRFLWVYEDELFGAAERHKLTNVESRRGGQKSKGGNIALLSVVKDICSKIRRNGEKPTRRSVAQWLVENATEDRPYETGVPDCEDIYLADDPDESKNKLDQENPRSGVLFWLDKKSSTRHISMCSLERYISRAKSEL